MALTQSGNWAGNQTASQTPSAQTRKTLNQQQQTPYATQNGMAQAGTTAALSGGQPQVQAASVASPVTPTGQINPTAQAPAAGTQPATSSPGAGWVATPGGGWVPPNHPLAATAQAGHAGGGAPTYSPQGLANASSQAIMNSLANPVYGPQWMAQAKGQAQDQNALAIQQMQQMAVQQNAASGTYGSGAMAKNLRRIADAGQSNLLDSNRALDLAAAQGNRDDLYRWAGLGMENFYTGRGQDMNQALGMAGVDADRYRTKAGILGSLLGYQSDLGRLGYDYTALNAANQQALWQSLLR